MSSGGEGTAGVAPNTATAGSSARAQFALQLQQRQQHRAANIACALRHEPRELKSDLKKGTAFAKKIRSYTAEHEASMMTELKTYNLKMFVKETAQGIGAALYEAPKTMKSSDITSFAVLCSALHQRYEDFLPEGLLSIKKGFDLTPLLTEMEKKFDPSATPTDVSRLRAVIRFLCEWWLLGLLPDSKTILGVLQRISMTLDGKAKGGSTEDAPNAAASTTHVTVNCLSIVNTIVRAVGIELMGTAPAPALQVAGNGASMLLWSEAEGKMSKVDESSQTIAIEQCELRRQQPAVQSNSYGSEAERAEFTKRVTNICQHSTQLCAKLKKGVEGKWRQMCEQAELRGDPSQEVKDGFHLLRKEAERIYVQTENLLSSVGCAGEMPPPIDLTLALQKSQVDVQLTFTSGTADFFTVRAAETMNYYDDDEQRSFYEELPSIDHLIPPMEDGGAGIPLSQQQIQRRGGNSANSDVLSMLDDSESAMQAVDGLTRGAGALPPQQRRLMDYSRIDELLVALHRCASIATTQTWLESYLAEATKYFFPEQLPPEVDAVRPSHARNFFLNCKMMLLIELRYEPDRAQELIPFLARVAAVMHSRFPEFGEALARQLENHIQDAVRNHRQGSFHAKLLNTRYLCELMKFRVCPPIRVIRICHLCMDFFEEEHAVLMSAIVLQHGASFLLRGGVTKAKMEECLLKMKQTAQSKGVHTRAETEYEHAWGELRRAMNPQRNRTVYTRIRTPLELYVSHLLSSRLQDNYDSVKFVQTRVLMLPWNDQGFPSGTTAEEVRATRDMLIRLFRKAHKVGYDRVHLLVEVIKTVTGAYGSACLLQPVVDHLLEDLRRDLEIGGTHRSMQKRLQDLKFMAELYNFRLLPLRVIALTVCELLLYTPNGPLHPADYSRLRCTLQVLRQSAAYFLRHGKAGAKQLTRKLLSLVFVHVHALAKPLPLDLDYCLEETLIELSKYYDDTLRRQRKTAEKRAGGGGGGQAKETYYFIEHFPRTPKAALEFLEQVRCESVLEENAFLDAAVQAFSSAEHKRCFPVLTMSSRSSGPIASTAETTLSKRSRPRVCPAESKRDLSQPEDDDDDDEDSSSSSDASDRSDEESSDSSASDSGSENSASTDSDSDEEEDDEEEEEDEEDEEEEMLQAPRMGPLANAHILNQRGPVAARGTTNDEDLEFDAMFRDALKDSSNEGAKRTGNKTTQQLEKLMESRLTSISMATVNKHLQMEDCEASARLLASHQQNRVDELAQRKARRGVTTQPLVQAGGEGPAAPASPAPTVATDTGAFRVAVLRRGAPATGGGSSGSVKPIDARSILIPKDSEFAQRSQAFVEQSQRDRALVHASTLKLLRQHEEEEARLHYPITRGGRGGRGGRW